MNRIVKIATPVFAAALIVGTLAGCGGQAASSSASASAASASATSPASPSAETQATTEETVAQLKAAMEAAKDFKSVTVTHKANVEVNASELAQSASAQSASAQSASASAVESDASATASDAAAEATSLNTTTVYKLDQSGETMKASSSCDFMGSTLKSFLDGDKAVVEVDGTAYAGTVEEMSVQEVTSFDELLKTKIGDFETLMSCVSAADVDKQGDNAVYALTIDTAKYAEADQIEKALAEAGLKKEALTLSYEFGADGKLLSVSVNTVTTVDKSQATLNFSDYDATVVDQAPQTDKTYADMSAEIKAAVEAIANEEQAASQNGQQ